MEFTHPTISYKFEINFNEIELAILKIAYEYAYLKLGNTYYDDKCGCKIRKTILKAINTNNIEECNLIHHLPNEDRLVQNIDYLKKQFNNSHFFQMQTVNEKILLTISLFCEMSLSYVINISDNADRYSNANFTEFIELNKNRK